MKYNILIIGALISLSACGSDSKGVKGKVFHPFTHQLSIVQGESLSVFEEDGSFDFTIELSEALAEDLIIDLVTQDISTQGAQDYNLLEDSVTIPAASLQANVTVELIDDMIKEPQEIFVIELFTQNDPTNALATLTVTIEASDALFLYQTPNNYSGNLGGRIGANQKCEDGWILEQDADHAAILSINEDDNVFHLQDLFEIDANLPIQDRDGKLIFENWEGLLYEAPLIPANEIVLRNQPTEAFWSGTNNETLMDSNINCAGFTTGQTGGAAGAIGDGGINFYMVSGICSNSTFPVLCLAKTL